MMGILEILADNGVVVVASAGNDSTSRPCYPAAFSMSWLSIPVVSVGALNPNRSTDALFSNVGKWVTTYQPGAALVSTMPPFQGGLEPIARTVAKDRPRESLDPDDFTSGFGVWSGTSFSSPVAAGLLARAMVGKVDAAGGIDEPSVAVDVARVAVGDAFPTGP
jgi:subtilisin family serine protease